jgi:hypothetical protein
MEWLPERVASNGRLAEGDRIRISIEAARSGYLYVVDCNSPMARRVSHT